MKVLRLRLILRYLTMCDMWLIFSSEGASPDCAGDSGIAVQGEGCAAESYGGRGDFQRVGEKMLITCNNYSE